MTKQKLRHVHLLDLMNIMVTRLYGYSNSQRNDHRAVSLYTAVRWMARKRSMLKIN